jgi:hypothetical protein
MSKQDPPPSRPSGPVKDARGRAVELLDPYELNLLRRTDLIPADKLRMIADEVGFGMPKWQRLGYLACVAAFIACVIFLVIWKLVRGRGIDAVERVLWPVNLAVFALGAVQFWRSGRRARAETISQVMLRHLRCPRCGYDLRLLPTDPTDGATVCPECGCAWEIEGSSSTDSP